MGGRGPKKSGSHTIGECFCSSASKDGTHEIFISPYLEESTDVLAVLLHELIHAWVGIKAKHGKAFKVVAVKAGLEGKMTATIAGADLCKQLKAWSNELGPYPHARLGMGGDRLKPKQGTRMLKLECPKCGYAARTTRKWLDVGLPTCVCGTKFTCGDAEDEDPE